MGLGLMNRVSSREFPGSRFPGNLRILAIFPVFPGIEIRDPGIYREIPGNFGFSNFPFPKVRENGNSTADDAKEEAVGLQKDRVSVLVSS